MPILMIGMRRSGSNLLRVMLNEAPGVVAPHPPHILMRMMPLASAYGDLSRNENFTALIEDVCQLVELNPVPWEGVTLDRADIAKRCRTRSVVAVFGAVYDVAAQAAGARDWICKSLENINYLPEIEATFDNPKYIYLYRDGRDVAVSTRKVVVGEKHIYHIASEWARIQRLALSHLEKTTPENFISIRYESLLAEPETTVRRICDFMQVPFTAGMLNFHESDEAKRTAAKSAGQWGNLAKPIMKNNTGKFLREESADDMRIFESVAGDVLDALGYERAFVQQGNEKVFTAEDVRRFDEENERMKGEVMGGLDTADRQRRDRQDALLVEIRGRSNAAA
jgi:hypothetical protein